MAPQGGNYVLHDIYLAPQRLQDTAAFFIFERREIHYVSLNTAVQFNSVCVCGGAREGKRELPEAQHHN